jgi:hypothetical protein
LCSRQDAHDIPRILNGELPIRILEDNDFGDALLWAISPVLQERAERLDVLSGVFRKVAENLGLSDGAANPQ